MISVAGSIGFYLDLALPNQDDEVIWIDNPNDYYDIAPKQLRLGEIAKQLQISNFEFIKADISDIALMEEVFTGHSFDVVVNLSA
jgi:UDP-glucuronate 4-epimerase